MKFSTIWVVAAWLLILLILINIASTSCAANLHSNVSSVVNPTGTLFILPGVDENEQGKQEEKVEDYPNDDYGYQSWASPYDQSEHPYYSPTLQPPQMLEKPVIDSMDINAKILYRYTVVQIIAQVRNPSLYITNEFEFKFGLPNSAFIASFAMNINGIIYKGGVKEKADAQLLYNNAMIDGLTAGLVSTEDTTNLFQMKINLRPSGKVVFNLTYEELLERRCCLYQISINVCPKQIVDIQNLKYTVELQESQTLTLLRSPKYIRDVEIYDHCANPKYIATQNIHVSRPSTKSAIIQWSPNAIDRLQIARENNGNFILQYEIERRSSGGEILLRNGYFVHFVAPSPTLVPPLRKHVVFLLDISETKDGVRSATNWYQLKTAVSKMLADLKPDDYFQIFLFSSSESGANRYYGYGSNAHGFVNNYLTPNPSLPSESMYQPFLATQLNKQIGITFLDSLNLHAHAPSDIGKEIDNALKYISTSKYSGSIPSDMGSVIVFMTDGAPPPGTSNIILNNVKISNADLHVSIYGFAFGANPNYSFLKKLCLQNYGFARRLYESSLVEIQLMNFYKEISSPLLSNVTFTYTSANMKRNTLTNTYFPYYYEGTEIIVVGKFDRKYKMVGNVLVLEDVHDTVVTINSFGRTGLARFGNTNVLKYQLVEDDNHFEKFWAYMTVKCLLDKYETSPVTFTDANTNNGAQTSVASSVNDKRPRVVLQALKIALKYGFVTPLTSLVIVKPRNDDGSCCLLYPTFVWYWYYYSFGYTAQYPALCPILPITLRGSRRIRSVDVGLIGQCNVGLHQDPDLNQSNISTSSTDGTNGNYTRQSIATATNLTLTVDDVTWIGKSLNNYSPMVVHGKTYKIASGVFEVPVKSYSCVQPQTGVNGTCKHLKDCVLAEFANNQQIYINKYFCSLRLRSKSNTRYAGVCC